MEEFPQSGEI